MNKINNYLISPSILSADFANLGEDVKNVLKAGANRIHFDVMDQHFVPNLSFGSMFVKSLRNVGITAEIDVHLMVDKVDEMIVDFANDGASLIYFHPEASLHVDRSLQLIESYNCKSGIVLNPATSIDYLDYISHKIDVVMLMSVNPGFGGQKFIENTYKKISDVRKKLNSLGCEHVRIEVDGGVNVKNIRKIANAGTDTFVAGSAIFNSKCYKDTIDEMRLQLSD